MTRWITIDSEPFEPLVVAPAEDALAWPGRRPTGRSTVHLTYWQPVMKALKQAHPELEWQGKRDTPFLRVDSDAAATSVLDKLAAFLASRFPDVKKKKQKELVQFRTGRSTYFVTVVVESGSEVLLAGTEKQDAWTAEVDGRSVVLWRPRLAVEGIRGRIGDDGFELVDSAADDLESLVTGQPTVHGTWTFDGGVAVVLSAPIGIRDCKGLESGSLADVQGVVANKPAVTLRVTEGCAAAFRMAPGAYRIETGGGKRARWLRVTR